MAARWLWQNFTQLGGATLSASSSQTTAPARWLRDQIRSKRWRSALGWTIVAGFNNKIDFIRSGTKAATVAPGTYATGALLSAAIVAALEAADATPVWACAYSSSTFKFTISSDLTFELVFTNAGVNYASSIHPCLGFLDVATGSAISHVANSVSYQSRHYLAVDIGSTIESKAVVLLDHNLVSAATVTAQWAATAVGSINAPTGTQALSGTTTRSAFISGTTYRYWAVIINNVASTDGFTEVGIWFVGSYLEPVRQVRPTVGLDRKEYSEVSFSDYGVNFLDAKGSSDGYTITYVMMTKVDADAFRNMLDFTKNGRNLFVCIDPSGSPTDVLYVFIEAFAAERRDAVPEHWNVEATIRVSLG